MSTYSNRLQPAVQNLLQRVVRFFHLRSSCTTTRISADVQRITLNASCMTISGGRTEQLDKFCCITGFTSDFLSFIDVELIRFFHGALQMQLTKRHDLSQRRVVSRRMVVARCATTCVCATALRPK